MDFDKKHWILYNKSGIVYFFNVLEQNLYIKIVGNNGVFYQAKILENVLDCFIVLDDEEIIHLVAILTTGDLKYCIYKNNIWDWRFLSKYDSKSYNFKNLRLFVIDGYIHILMAYSNIAQNESWVLKHHYWDQKKWFNKKIYTINTEKYDIPFQADMDSKKNIHLVFRSMHNGNYQIFYCKYSSLHKTWGIPVNISNSKESHLQPFIFCDTNDVVHITWCGFYRGDLVIYYISNHKLDSSREDWELPKRLTGDGMNGMQPVIYQTDQNLQVVWRYNNKFVIKTFYLQEQIWGELKEIEISDYINCCFVSVIGRYHPNYMYVKIPATYGIIKDEDILLIGLDELTVNNISSISDSDEPQYNDSDSEQIKEQILGDKSIFQEDKEVIIELQLDDMMTMMDLLHNRQEQIDTKFFVLKEEQENNKQKINELARLYLQLNEILVTNTNNKSLLQRLKNIFVIGKKYKKGQDQI